MNIEKLSLSDFCAAELVANEWLPIVYAGAATSVRMTETTKTERLVREIGKVLEILVQIPLEGTLGKLIGFLMPLPSNLGG